MEKTLSTRTYRAIYNGIYSLVHREIAPDTGYDKREATEKEKTMMRERHKKYFTLQWLAENFHGQEIANFRGMGVKAMAELKKSLESEGFSLEGDNEKSFIPKYYNK